jgi:ankyrin repeat protein
VVRLLVERHAPLDTQDYLGATALTWACILEQRTVAATLALAGARTDIVDSSGRTAESYADEHHFGDLLRHPPASVAATQP